MKNELVIKTYDIDYSFIVKNYLDKELWEKEWTLFVYKNFVFKLSLSNIDTKRDIITFDIEGGDGRRSHTKYLYYHRKQSNLEILKKQIDGCIFSLIEFLEYDYIIVEKGYQTIRDAEDEEEDMLREIAEEFLDDEGVSNKEIREVYIDNYIYNNKKTDTYLSNYKTGRKYCVLSDLYLVYTTIVKDETRYEIVKSKIENNPYFENILEEVNEYIEQLQDEEQKEELIEEFKGCLEAI